jgi:N-acetylmuramate 1-kinase
MDKSKQQGSMETRLSTSSARYQAMVEWAQEMIGDAVLVDPLAQDASSRGYYRVSSSATTHVVMDAPDAFDQLLAFTELSTVMNQSGVRVPEVICKDMQRGFLLLSDFGDNLYSQQLTLHNADHLYHLAFDSLLLLQNCDRPADYSFPVYTAELLHKELSWFEQWYLNEHVGVTLSVKEQDSLNQMFVLLVEQAMSQPQVVVHKDYHSRNLMMLPSNGVGVLDFQDALIGPITYDLMSLTYDHYIEWPRKRIESWVDVFYQRLLDCNVLKECDFSLFLQWHDWLAIQRVMKNLGNFVRLAKVHNKPRYLQNMPRIYHYILFISQQYKALAPLAQLLLRYKPESL